MDPLIGYQINMYRIDRFLSGSGGMADVYIGKHVFLKKKVAIKVLKGTFIDNEAKRDFIREAETLAALDHPNIIPIYDCGILPDGRPFFVMQYAKSDLTQHILGKKPGIYPIRLSLEEVLEYAVPIAQALHYAHQHKLVHRDVKPQNILVSEQGVLWLSDFGIATLTFTDPDALRVTRNIVGTLPYMAPEQFLGKPCRETDQYALGVMIYEWICGKRPFNAAGIPDITARANRFKELHMTESIPFFASHSITGVDIAVEWAVRRALAKDYTNRFPTVLDFVKALEDARTQQIYQEQAAREDLEGWIERYNQMIKDNPQDAGAYVWKGIKLSHLGRYEEALATFDQVLKLYPKDVGALYSKGLVLLDLCQDEEALTAFDLALKVYPEFGRAHLYKGNALYNLGRDTEALAAHEQACRFDPTLLAFNLKKGRR